jgi:outer membrane protein OmpA-like peptidoglycan-associated protein
MTGSATAIALRFIRITLVAWGDQINAVSGYMRAERSIDGRIMRMHRRCITVLLLTAVLASATAGACRAQTQPQGQTFEKTLEDQIENALRPRNGGNEITRGLPNPTDPEAQDAAILINRLRTRSISIEDRDKIVEISKNLPKIDLDILFASNSAAIRAAAMPSLIALGNAIANGPFKDDVFFINGYADGRGDAKHNQKLSQRRADAVRQLLIEHYHLAPDALIAVGFGATQFKTPEDPFAPENRRVEIVNTTLSSGPRKDPPPPPGDKR